MARKPRYARHYQQDAYDAIMSGKCAHKALAMALGISPSTLSEWIETYADFAATVDDARIAYEREKAASAGKAGRKSKYSPDMDDAARIHAATGKTDDEIAHELGISITTLRNWRISQPGLHLAIQDGRDHWAVTSVEASLLKRAQGYEYTETSTETSSKGQRTVVVRKHMPPDTKAAQFVLTNRAPERWTDKQKVETELSGGLEIKWQE